MKKSSSLAIVFFLTFFTSFIFAQNNPITATPDKPSVSEDEINSVTNQVEFENYKGSRDTTKSAQSIIDLGKYLTRDMQRSKNGEAGDSDRYFIKNIRPGDRLFGADVISLGPKAQMNHIKNVTRLVRGYIEEKHKYRGKKAETIAFFVLVYNAVKRTDEAYFKDRFAPELLAYVPTGKYGIDTKYVNWPGATYIIIPMTLGFSAAEVWAQALERVKKESNNIAAREDMLKIVKDEAKENAKDLAKREEDLNKKGGGTDAEKKALQDDKIKQADLEEKIKDEQKAIDQAKGNDSGKGSDANADAGKDAGKGEDVAQPNLSEGKIFFLKTLGRTGVHLSQELNMIDPVSNTAQVLDVQNVSGRYLNFIEEDPILIMFDSPEHLNLHLARVDRKSLKVKAKGSEDIFHDSRIWLFGESLYVIGTEGAKSYLMKYDKDLKLAAKSTVPIYPDTEITYFDGKLYCTVMNANFNSHIVVLKEDTLAVLVEIGKK